MTSETFERGDQVARVDLAGRTRYYEVIRQFTLFGTLDRLLVKTDTGSRVDAPVTDFVLVAKAHVPTEAERDQLFEDLLSGKEPLQDPDIGCRICGAAVVDEDFHRNFHRGLVEAFTSTSSNFKLIAKAMNG